MIFKRKIYDKLLKWKENSKGESALLIEGARRIGKSTIVEEFAKNEYKSYILIDFSVAGEEVKSLFEDLRDLDFFFIRLQSIYDTFLYYRESLIIFDEVQLCPKARQAIKHLVKDGRYDYIETGSLISIRQNTKDILIPSEEEKVKMFPLDFEEFLDAIGDKTTITLLRQAYENAHPLGDVLHREMMRKFRLYMLIGGMPQAVVKYLESNNFQAVDSVKRRIIELYKEDFLKIDPRGRISDIFASIPAQLNSNRTFYTAPVKSLTSAKVKETLIPNLVDSQTVLIKYRCSDPGAGLSSFKDLDTFKLYLSDTGLFITEAFADKTDTDNEIYVKIWIDKLSANFGYLYENAVAQALASNGYALFYNTFRDDTAHRNFEIDFLIPHGSKICPIEVKSGDYHKHHSLDVFSDKYSSDIFRRYIITTKDYAKEKDIIRLPIYMTMFL